MGEKVLPFYILAVLCNTDANRYHPIAFREAPRPSDDGVGLVRYKSASHHTVGFPDRDSALTFMRETMVGHFAGAELCVEGDFEWDGVGVPALVVSFVRHDGVLVPC